MGNALDGLLGGDHLNAPGHWDFFISHTQRNGEATALAEGLYTSLKEKGYSVWLDVKMSEKNEDAMREGVLGARCVLAIITEGPDQENNYFNKEWLMNYQEF